MPHIFYIFHLGRCSIIRLYSTERADFVRVVCFDNKTSSFANDVEKATLIEGFMLTWVMLLVTGVRDLPKLKPLEIWAVLCNCRDQMFKLDLQGNSLSRAHRKHSQILLQRYISYYIIISSVRSSSVYHGLLHTQQRSSTHFSKFFKFFRF